MRALVLLDIDATLLLTGGAGIRAMQDAGRSLHGPGFTLEGVDFAGNLDPLIYAHAMARAGLPRSPGDEHRFRDAYAQRLVQALSTPDHAPRALPGALSLVEALRAEPRGALGVLTGNYAPTGRIKLSACGFDPDWFPICAWGDDSPHPVPDREHLPPVAMRRHRERFGVELDPRRVTIVGDTPHDVRCARASGCRVLGVATGKYTVDQLRSCGADHVVPDLSDTPAIMSWLCP
jgi:phosphoglycolate phosphatase-like HAD superfamily hydrolase